MTPNFRHDTLSENLPTLRTGGTQSFQPQGTLWTGGTQSFQPPRYPEDCVLENGCDWYWYSDDLSVD